MSQHRKIQRYRPEDPARRVHIIILESEWKELGLIAEQANTTSSGLIRACIYTFLKHAKANARQAIDEIERELHPPKPGDLTLPNELTSELAAKGEGEN